jgi:hydrogenase expression/formation protein HypD
MKYIDDYKNPEAASYIRKQIKLLAEELTKQNKTANIMEVCGSHTMAIGRFAIRELLPENVKLISGPGCPVCVTDSGYVDAAIQLAERNDVVIATFGDMINVPGSNTTLAKCRSGGAHIEVCHSPTNTMELSKKYPDKQIVFLAIGFETTTAPVLGLLSIIEKQNIKNISLLTAFKLVPPALEALTSDPELNIDAFLCPAHVSVIIGSNAYKPFVKKHKIPCVIASFEPVEIMFGLMEILKQLVNSTPEVKNQYKRFVNPAGSPKALELISKYLEIYDASWRGIGYIPNSGVKLKKEYSKFDAAERFNFELKPGKPNPACRCGDVLKGKLLPSACPLFAKACNPLNPIGPCMVSSEGSCAAYYKYSRTKH